MIALLCSEVRLGRVTLPGCRADRRRGERQRAARGSGTENFVRARECAANFQRFRLLSQPRRFSIELREILGQAKARSFF